MNDCLHAVATSSRVLVADASLSHSLRKLACAVHQGAHLIHHHQLDASFELPHFEQALFHLCHVVGRPLCGRQACCAGTPGEIRRCDAIVGCA